MSNPLVLEVAPRQHVHGADGVAVAVREGAQLHEAGGHGGGEAVLAADVGGHQQVVRRLRLVGAVRAAQLLHLWV